MQKINYLIYIAHLNTLESVTFDLYYTTESDTAVTNSV